MLKQEGPRREEGKQWLLGESPDFHHAIDRNYKCSSHLMFLSPYSSFHGRELEGGGPYTYVPEAHVKSVNWATFEGSGVLWGTAD